MASLDDFQPELVVLSGLHMMEGQGRQLWEERLKEVSGLKTALNVHIFLLISCKSYILEVVILQTLVLVDCFCNL